MTDKETEAGTRMVVEVVLDIGPILPGDYEPREIGYMLFSQMVDQTKPVRIVGLAE